MGLLNEVLNSIKIIKYYAWEMKFMDKVNAARETELKNLLVHINTYVYYYAYTYIHDDTELLPMARLSEHTMGGCTCPNISSGVHHTYIHLGRAPHPSHGLLLPDDFQPSTVPIATVSGDGQHAGPRGRIREAYHCVS